VTGNSGVGKSTICALLKSRGELAFDADSEGFNYWMDRESGQVVADRPYPVPPGWLDRFDLMISRVEVEALAARVHGKTAFLCGSAENEAGVRDLFDLVVCVVVDSETLRERLLTREANAFGKHPDQLAAVLMFNEGVESFYRRLGATIIDGSRPAAEVADAILAAATTVPRPEYQAREPDVYDELWGGRGRHSRYTRHGPRQLSRACSDRSAGLASHCWSPGCPP